MGLDLYKRQQNFTQDTTTYSAVFHEEYQETSKMLSQITFLIVVALASSHPTYPAAQPSLQFDSGYHTYPQPQAAPEPEVNIDYKMSLAVQDDETANYQTREESKEGKIIKGSYTVLEPTGELRVVNYYADENGFQADVQNKPAAAPAYKPQYPKNDHYAPAAAPQNAYPAPEASAPVKMYPAPEAPNAPIFFSTSRFPLIPGKLFSAPKPEHRPQDAGSYHQAANDEGHGY